MPPFVLHKFINYILQKCKVYFRFFSVWINRLGNNLLANYLRNRSNDLATVRISAICGAMLPNNSFMDKVTTFLIIHKAKDYLKSQEASATHARKVITKD